MGQYLHKEREKEGKRLNTSYQGHNITITKAIQSLLLNFYLVRIFNDELKLR